jgi:regulator of RNase E activity RraA
LLECPQANPVPIKEYLILSDQPLSESEFAALRALDTPTVCNALEITSPERRAIGFTTTPLVCARPHLPSIVGYARTATLRAMQPTVPDIVDRIAYYDYVAGGQGPTITIIEDIDDQPGFGAFWGEVNTNIHQAIGCLGVITNGSIRDLPDCAQGFVLLAGNVGPSHAHVHIVDFGKPVTIHGMAVQSGDLIHADQHGAVIIPHDVARDIPAAAASIVAREAIVLAACKAPGAGIASVKAALSKAAEYH